MSFRLIEMVLQSSISDPTETAVMIAIASHADKYCSCYPSIARICELSRYKERAVQGAIRRLSERGIISVKTGGGRGGSSFYTIFPSALNPAADAPINGDKPRSRNPVSKTETPQQMRETPHLTTKNPAADAPEPVIEPVKNNIGGGSARAREPEIATLRERILTAIGVDPVSGITGRGGAVLGSRIDMDRAQRWQADLGLTECDVITVISEAVARKRDGPPGSFAYFDKAMQREAARKAEPPMKPTEGDRHDQQPARQSRESAADDAFARRIHAAARARSPSDGNFGFG